MRLECAHVVRAVRWMASFLPLPPSPPTHPPTSSASLTAFALLGAEAGYTLVYADKKGVNLFFVANELQPTAHFLHAGDEAALWKPAGYADCQLYFRSAGHCEDSKIGTNREYLSAATLLGAQEGQGREGARPAPAEEAPVRGEAPEQSSGDEDDEMEDV